MEFPVSDLIDALPTNAQFHGGKYGEVLKGVLGIEMLFMYKSSSIFKIRYYSEQLEFERKLMNIDTHILMNKIDMDEFQPQFTVNDLRTGVYAEPLQIKIIYSRTFRAFPLQKSISNHSKSCKSMIYSFLFFRQNHLLSTKSYISSE